MAGLARGTSIAIAVPIAIAISGRPPVVIVRVVGPQGPWKAQDDSYPFFHEAQLGAFHLNQGRCRQTVRSPSDPFRKLRMRSWWSWCLGGESGSRGHRTASSFPACYSSSMPDGEPLFEAFRGGGLHGEVSVEHRPTDVVGEVTRVVDPSASVKTIHWGRNFIYAAVFPGQQGRAQLACGQGNGAGRSRDSGSVAVGGV